MQHKWQTYLLITKHQQHCWTKIFWWKQCDDVGWYLPHWKKLGIIGGNPSTEIYQDDILQPVAIPHVHSLGPKSIFQDDNTRPHKARCVINYLQNLGAKRMEWLASSPDLNPTSVGSAWVYCQCQTDQQNHVGVLAKNAGWRMGRHPTAVCDKTGDQLFRDFTHNTEACEYF